MLDFFALSAAERLEALNAAASSSGRSPPLLEKDIWVVWVLRHLFTVPHAGHLVFQGGTSRSKAYGVIRQVSEDVDLTYDIRTIAGDLVGNGIAPLPTNRSREKKWSKENRARLVRWVADEIVPALRLDLARQSLPATVHDEDDKVLIDYVPVSVGKGYAAPSVMLEFGARSTGEPSQARPILCDAAAYLPMLDFPMATPQLMRAERTFWEKATAIHVFCAQGTFRGGERFARHWHDVTRLNAAGFVDAALADPALARQSPTTNAYSSPRRPGTERPSIITRRLPAVCAWCLMPLRWTRWRSTTSRWLMTGGGWMTSSRLTI